MITADDSTLYLSSTDFKVYEEQSESLTQDEDVGILCFLLSPPVLRIQSV